MRSVNRSIWPCARFLVIFRDAGAVISTRPDFHRRSVLPELAMGARRGRYRQSAPAQLGDSTGRAGEARGKFREALVGKRGEGSFGARRSMLISCQFGPF